MTVLIAGLLAAHGAVHGIMFGLSFSDRAMGDLPFDPARSWLLGHTPHLAVTLAAIVTAAFTAAALAYLARTGWWPQLTVTAAGASLGLLLLYHNRYWSVGYAIDALIAVLAWRAAS